MVVVHESLFTIIIIIFLLFIIIVTAHGCKFRFSLKICLAD